MNKAKSSINVFTLFLVMLSGARAEQAFIPIGHRGSGFSGSTTIIENSLSSFKQAQAEGAKGIEYDVVWTKDGHNVVFHDRYLTSRVCQGNMKEPSLIGGLFSDLKVEDMTLAEVRKKCTLINGERLMTLDEMFEATKGMFDYYFLEIKNYSKSNAARKHQVQSSYASIARAGLQDKVILISYDTLATKIFGKVPGFLGAWDDHHGSDLKDALKAGHPYYGIDYNDLTPEIAKAVHARGKTIFTYTVNDPTALNRLYDMGVKLVLTDNVAMLRRYHYENPNRGRFDVGVIPAKSCSVDQESVEIYMDDEDKGNKNRSGGWIGAIGSGKNTMLRFCRVDGRAFSALKSKNRADGDFAVLKLGDECPEGSFQVNRTIDNSDRKNENYSMGDIRPNISRNNTFLQFCQFKSHPSASATALPRLDMGYGVFAAPSFRFGGQKGFFRSDDSDKNNQNAMNGDEFTRLIFAETDNTTFNVVSDGN